MVFHGISCDARMVDMNWFLLTLPVTILYESTGMPKIRSGEPDPAGSDDEASAEEMSAEEGAAAVSPPLAGAGVVLSAVTAALAPGAVADAESATAAVALSEASDGVGFDAGDAFSAEEGFMHETVNRSEAARSAGKRADNLIQQY
jgi:hypothetical protein